MDLEKVREPNVSGVTKEAFLEFMRILVRGKSEMRLVYIDSARWRFIDFAH